MEHHGGAPLAVLGILGGVGADPGDGDPRAAGPGSSAQRFAGAAVGPDQTRVFALRFAAGGGQERGRRGDSTRPSLVQPGLSGIALRPLGDQ